MAFGMFGLGDHIHANMTYFSKTYPIYCLVPEGSPESGLSLPNALALAYGGPGLAAQHLCVASPWAVPLDHTGYEEIASQQSTDQMEHFVNRLVHHPGAVVREGQGSKLRAFAAGFVGGSGDSFARMASELGSQPSWLAFSDDARCMANRDAEPGVIGKAIGWACSNSPSLNCSGLPEECNTDPYRVGDYVFSRYYRRHGDTSNPLLGCSFQGAAVFAPPNIFNAWNGASLCAEASTTTTTSTITSTSTSTRTTSTVTITTFTTSTVKAAAKPSFMGASQPVAPWLSLLSLLAGLTTAFQV